MPPLNNEFESNVPPETWKTSISALFLVMVQINTVCTLLRTFVASSALSRLRASWGGTLGQNLVVGGTQTFLRTETAGEQESREKSVLAGAEEKDC